MLRFYNEEDFTSVPNYIIFNVQASVSPVDNEPPEENLPEIEVLFYLGGKLVDKKFAEQNKGVWTVTVDQNNIVRRVDNTYSSDSTENESGSRALLEVELRFLNQDGVEFSPEDKLLIEGQIRESLRDFKFTK